jgi:hypothetical protein
LENENKFEALEKLRDIYPEDDFDDFIGWYKENGFNHASKREDIDRFVDKVLSDKINIKNDFKVFFDYKKTIRDKNDKNKKTTKAQSKKTIKPNRPEPTETKTENKDPEYSIDISNEKKKERTVVIKKLEQLPKLLCELEGPLIFNYEKKTEKIQKETHEILGEASKLEKILKNLPIRKKEIEDKIDKFSLKLIHYLGRLPYSDNDRKKIQKSFSIEEIEIEKDTLYDPNLHTRVNIVRTNGPSRVVTATPIPGYKSLLTNNTIKKPSVEVSS